jgi:DNA-binding XRE family transcriptional regulator
MGRLELEQDFLDELITEQAQHDPELPRRVEEGVRRLERLHALIGVRKAARVSQATIATQMGVPRSTVSGLETGDVQVTTEILDQYAATLAQAKVQQALRATS